MPIVLPQDHIEPGSPKLASSQSHPMRTRYALALLTVSCATLGRAQYCSPSFVNGCFNWRALSVNAGSIAWTPGTDDCSVSDYTSMSTTVNAGDDLSMQVTSGVWCGCAVWVDLDQSNSFEDAENLYYIYVGGEPSYTYDFSISIPAGTPSGNYRMRIISPWGSDGFLDTNTNGYGPCGSFQYGNFNDFTLNVINTIGVAETEASALFTMSPNPGEDMVSISGLPFRRTVSVSDATGRVLVQRAVQADRLQLDVRDWTPGLYFVRVDGMTQRLIVR